jgi:hypothetical protein
MSVVNSGNSPNTNNEDEGAVYFLLIYSLQISIVIEIKKKTLHGLSPRANYTDRATAACRRSDCQLLRIECATWSA